MALKLYMDHHVPRSITLGLRLRDVVVLTAFEDQAHEFSDDELLSRASHHGCVLFSQDDDLLVVAARRLNEGTPFNGLIYGRQLRLSFGDCVKDLELLAKAATSEDLMNQVIFLPL